MAAHSMDVPPGGLDSSWCALGSVLRAFGYDAEPYRESSAWIVLAAPKPSVNSPVA